MVWFVFGEREEMNKVSSQGEPHKGHGEWVVF